MSEESMDIRWNPAPDPRRRAYASPVRVVWRTETHAADDGWEVRAEARGTELLLEPKRGQVCEGPFGTSRGTRLANRGEPAGMLLDFGCELHGGLSLAMSPSTTPGARLRLRFGESVSEAMSDVGDGRHATNDHAMRDFVVEVPRFGTLETGHTGFRFVRIDLVSGGVADFESVRAVSLERPMERLGAFRSSDDRLDLVWETAVRTVRLCCQDFLWDGIKRDRLVWAGDMHPETTAVLDVFGAQPVLPETFDYLAGVTPPGAWMNDMPAYTLWWIRCVAEWYRRTGDAAFVRERAGFLGRTFDLVFSGIRDGAWRAASFLDWPTKPNAPASAAGAQALALLAARDAALLAEAAGLAEAAEKARAMAAALAAQRPDPHGAKSAAALLALAGLRDPGEMFAGVLGRGGVRGFSTFYGGYMLEAMSEAGETRRALDAVRDYWGGMLDAGATTFWEDFDVEWLRDSFRIDELPVPGRRDVHGDFGAFCYAGFRRSLCHGWSCGPASWCIRRILGIRPLGVGCHRVEVRPDLAGLDWAEGAMALPGGGRIRVRAERTSRGGTAVSVDAPPDVVIVRSGFPRSARTLAPEAAVW